MSGIVSGADEQPRAQGETLGDSMNDGVASEQQALRLRLGRGQSIDRYVILYELGIGGMGVVYAAYDPELDRKVALKLLLADSIGSRGRTRLLREAKAIARLSHPNVITVHDVGTFENRVFVAMEHIDGVTFRQWMQQGRRGWRDIVDVLRPAGEGLACAHAADLIHRDFKPDNILVEATGRVVVLDFGLARKTGSEDDPPVDLPPETPASGDAFERHLTRTGAKLGTPAYMAPEQHLSAATDGRTDQFSFCVVMWEALYGARPFGGETRVTTALQVVSGVLQEPPRASKVPGWIRRILVRGLATDPRARYPNMRALLEDLGRDPVAKLRKRALAAGLAGAGLAIGWGTYHAVDDEPVPCNGGATRWDLVWNEQGRDQMRSAFLSTRTPFAETAWHGARRGLDAYVYAWSSAHREACEATHIHHEQSMEMLDLRMGCLRTRMNELAALTREFAMADAAMVENAVEAVQGLPSLDACSDADGLAVRLRPPADPETRSQVELLRSKLADAGAKEYAARYEQAQQIVSEVLTAAEALDYPPMMAEANLRMASILERRGNFAASERRLLASIWAAEASHHDEVAAQAWVRLVWISGVERFDVAQGHLWASFAQAAVDRLGNAEPLQAALIHNIGGVLYREQHLEQAIEHYRRALEMQERLLGPRDRTVAMTLNHIGNVLMEQHRYEAAREYCERSLQLRRSVLGDRHPKVAASLNNIAEIYRKQGNAERTLEYAEQSLEITGGGGGPEEAVALVQAGTALGKLGRHDQALAALERVVALERARNPEMAAGSLAEIARVHRVRGDARAAEHALREAVQLAKSAGASESFIVTPPEPDTPRGNR